MSGDVGFGLRNWGEIGSEKVLKEGKAETEAPEEKDDLEFPPSLQSIPGFPVRGPRPDAPQKAGRGFAGQFLWSFGVGRWEYWAGLGTEAGT